MIAKLHKNLRVRDYLTDLLILQSAKASFAILLTLTGRDFPGSDWEAVVCAAIFLIMFSKHIKGKCPNDSRNVNSSKNCWISFVVSSDKLFCKGVK